MGERDRHECKFAEHALEKRQLNLDAVLVGVRRRVAAQKAQPLEQFLVHPIIDGTFAERGLPARPRAQRGLVAARAVIDPEQDDPRGGGIQAIVKMRGAGAGVDRPGVGHQAGGERRLGGALSLRAERAFIKAIVEERAQLVRAGGIKRSGDGGGSARGHRTSGRFFQGATISTWSTPMPSMSPSTLSPGFRNTGGTRAKPTPEGVPVLMISPGSSVMPADRLSMIVGMSKIMSRVLPSCITSPLTRQMSRTCCGSGSALLCTIHGPSGQKVSRDLPLYHWPCRRCSSRAVMSRQTV